ncbi:hypothetical protein AB0L65_40325 [Nonomuraea sp. NPDC052116]|uniref:hypothetical protein n=1 Tax=Nonomuraea sp. NPDC052116 TaxID=3155665 RepID=UPI0034373A24
MFADGVLALSAVGNGECGRQVADAQLRPRRGVEGVDDLGRGGRLVCRQVLDEREALPADPLDGADPAGSRVRAGEPTCRPPSRRAGAILDGMGA